MFLAWLKAQPVAAPLDPRLVPGAYRYWRTRILSGLFVGYALFYLIRLNLAVATPAMMSELQLSKSEMGLFSSVFGLLYGLSKFVNGMLGDRANLRYFMALGLMFASLACLFFGLSTAFESLLVFWALNAWFQGMGWPPCARGLTQWFSTSERGTFWGIWNASHQVGGVIIIIAAGYLVAHHGWRAAFVVPAIFTFGMGFFLINRLRDRPQSLGLPPIEEFKAEPTGGKPRAGAEPPFWACLRRDVLGNPAIWALALGNFFVYVVRYGVLTWAILYLTEVKGTPIAAASVKGAGFEAMGLVGAFSAGYLSDRFFRGRRGPVSFIYMVILIPAIVLFWLNPPGNPSWDLVGLGLVGFFVYGPQMLVGVSAADLAGKDAAATATGFTGWLGYFGQVFAGYGIGKIVDLQGWGGGFAVLTGCAVLGALCFAATWNAKPGNPGS